MKARGLFTMSALALALALTVPWAVAQQTPRPMLADYFTEFASTLPSAGYAPLAINETVTEDLNGDGNQDLVVLGANYPGGTSSTSRSRDACSSETATATLPPRPPISFPSIRS